MYRLWSIILAVVAVAVFNTARLSAQTTPPPAAGATVPTPPTMPAMPPGIGPQIPANGRGPGAVIGAPGFPPPGMPGAAETGAERGIGARPALPDLNQGRPFVRQEPPPASGSARLIGLLDSSALYVQAFDFVLMLIAGLFCLRARRSPGLTILAVSCFVSAIILLGFFVYGLSHGQGAFSQSAYIVARLLAPFELLLFAIGLITVARRSSKV